MAESFFATLECELIDRCTFQTQAEARMAIFEFIEAWYNRKRRHSALGYLSPEEFERVAAKGASRPAATTNGNTTEPIGLGAVRIDDLEVHSGLHELSDPSVYGYRLHHHRRSLTSTLVTKAQMCPPDRG